MEVLTKDMITRSLLLHLLTRFSDCRAAADLVEMAGAICYKLKTGCQWRWLLAKVLLTGTVLSMQAALAYRESVQCLVRL